MFLQGVCHIGIRLLFKFRSGKHGLNGELGRTECFLCGDQCNSVSHVLWECSAYSTCSLQLVL